MAFDKARNMGGLLRLCAEWYDIPHGKWMANDSDGGGKAKCLRSHWSRINAGGGFFFVYNNWHSARRRGWNERKGADKNQLRLSYGGELEGCFMGFSAFFPGIIVSLAFHLLVNKCRDWGENKSTHSSNGTLMSMSCSFPFSWVYRRGFKCRNGKN